MTSLKEHSAEEYFNLANAYFEQENFDQAIKSLTQAIQLYPSDCSFYSLRARCYANQDSHELALADCNKAIELRANSDAYFNRGNVYFFSKNYEPAIADYDKAIELDKDSDAYCNRAIAHLFLGEPKLALADYEKMLTEKSPNTYEDDKKIINSFLFASNLAIHTRNYDKASEFIEYAFQCTTEEYQQFKKLCLENISNVEALEKKDQELEEKNKELNNLVAMFAHNFLGTLQCIRSNAEHDNNPNIHLKTVKMMGGALTAFSILSADDDKLAEQLKQDNTGETNLLQNLANSLALAVSQLLGKTNKDKIINLYLNYLRKTQQIEKETTGEVLRENRDYRKKWQSLQHQWEDEFNALFSEKADLSLLQKWITDNFFPVEIIGFDSCNISFKEYGITDSIFLIVFMEIFVNAFKYMDVRKNESLTLKLCEEDLCYKLVCENQSSQETGRGTHKGMDFLKTIAKKLNGNFITKSTENSFKTTFAIPSELLK